MKEAYAGAEPRGVRVFTHRHSTPGSVDLTIFIAAFFSQAPLTPTIWLCIVGLLPSTFYRLVYAYWLTRHVYFTCHSVIHIVTPCTVSGPPSPGGRRCLVNTYRSSTTHVPWNIYHVLYHLCLSQYKDTFNSISLGVVISRRFNCIQIICSFKNYIYLRNIISSFINIYVKIIE